MSVTELAALAGFARGDGRVGCRNHVLVLPSVVCSAVVARRIAGKDAVVLLHQHGCDHVGEDAAQTADILAGVAANPNVGAVLVVGLGCETIQGMPLAAAIQVEGRRAEYLGIQEAGGSANTIELGQERVGNLVGATGRDRRVAVPLSSLTVGVAVDDWSSRQQLVEALWERARGAGARFIAASAAASPPVSGPWGSAAMVRYGGAASAGLSLALGAGFGAEQHAGLAAAGAQVIVSLRGRDAGPVGFPVCPVISVAGSHRAYVAMSDDFDLDGSESEPQDLAAELWTAVREVFNGLSTASERRGAAEFALQRLSRST